MQRLEVNGAVRLIYRSLGVKGLTSLFGRLSGIRTQSGQTNCEECGPCPVFASYTLAYALQLRKSTEKPYLTLLTRKSLRVIPRHMRYN